MDIFINSEELPLLRRILDIYPVDGITTNPQMISYLGKGIDYVETIKAYRKLAGDKIFMTQVVSRDLEGMLAEAKIIRNLAGNQTYVKFPANETGLKAIAQQAAQGFNTTGTIIFSAMQAIFALKAGAKYVAFFFNPMLEAGLDPIEEIRNTAAFIKEHGCDGKIMSGAMRKFEQPGRAIEAGARSLTMNPDFYEGHMSRQPFVDKYEDFMNSWNGIYDGKTIIDLYGEGK